MLKLLVFIIIFMSALVLIFEGLDKRQKISSGCHVMTPLKFHLLKKSDEKSNPEKIINVNDISFELIKLFFTEKNILKMVIFQNPVEEAKTNPALSKIAQLFPKGAVAIKVKDEFAEEFKKELTAHKGQYLSWHIERNLFKIVEVSSEQLTNEIVLSVEMSEYNVNQLKKIKSECF